jgi:hypothetical protein
MKATTFKVPKKFGECADRLYRLREEKSALNKKVENLDEERKAIETYLINNLSKQDQTGAVGHVAQAVIVPKVAPSCKNWPLFYKHILKTKDFSLLGRRLADSAIKEQWENGKKIPGVEAFNYKSVSVTKKA